MPIHTEIDERHATPEASAAAEAVLAASRRLASFALETPLVRAATLAPAAWYKCENLQRTGSFKLRGALNKMLVLSAEERERGVVTSSTGNHGLALAAALQMTSGRGTVIVSRSASRYKIERLERAGLEVMTSDGDPMAAELEARALAEREGRVYVSPYNDADVLAGQGTVGVELLTQRADLEAVFIAVGGGGLVSGVAAYLKSVRPDVTVVGCWPERAAAMYQSVRAGRLVEVPDEDTLSDGTAGNIEPGAITFPLCRDLIDELVLVSEDAIAAAMRDVLLTDHLLIEGSAGVAVAGWRAFTAARPKLAHRVSAIVLCGGNVSAATISELLAADR
ncbi:MAG TPA: threonine/serine dehydratase [Gemmatimonadaceae bacterium]|nr:threonine/serine dehydratase [Gemmatimonadaceae bacterium]